MELRRIHNLIDFFDHLNLSLDRLCSPRVSSETQGSPMVACLQDLDKQSDFERLGSWYRRRTCSRQGFVSEMLLSSSITSEDGAGGL